MIRSAAIVIKLGSSPLVVTASWKDPARLRDRPGLDKLVRQALERFQIRMKLTPAGKFELEDMALFLIKDKGLGAFRVLCADTNTGAQVEVDQDMLTTNDTES